MALDIGGGKKYFPKPKPNVHTTAAARQESRDIHNYKSQPTAIYHANYGEPSPPQSYQPGSVGRLAPVIDRYLTKYDSPLAGLGRVFTRKARKRGIDPRLLVAIAGAESGFGKNMKPGTNNPFGWGPHIPFKSVPAAIGAVSKGLAENYFGQGLDTIPKIQQKWAPIGVSNDPTNLNSNWTGNVQRYYDELSKMKPRGGRTFPILNNVQYKDLGGPAAHGARAMGNWQSDNAADFGVPPGTPVYSPTRGRLTGGFGPSSNGSNVWGHRLSLYSPRLGNSLFYTHLDPNRLAGLSPGAKVKKGQVLGYVGDMPGYPSHLHFGTQSGDPYAFARGGYIPFSGSSLGGGGGGVTGPTSYSQAAKAVGAQSQASAMSNALLASGFQESPQQGRKRKKGKSSLDYVNKLIQALLEGQAGANMMGAV